MTFTYKIWLRDNIIEGEWYGNKVRAKSALLRCFKSIFKYFFDVTPFNDIKITPKIQK